MSVETAIEGMRDAAIFPARWPEALDRFGQAFDSCGVTLVLKSTTKDSIACSNSVQPFVAAYMSGEYRDPREERVNPSLGEGFMPDRAYFSAREIAREPYYQEFLRPRGFGWNAIAALHGDLMISVKRAFARGPYEGDDLRQLDASLPWLRSVSRAASLTWHSNFLGQLSAFERLHRGAMLLDGRGRILQSNNCVRFGDGLDVHEGVLQVPRAADQTRLRRFLTSLLTPQSLTDRHPPPSLLLPRLSGGRPWLLDGISCGEAMRSLHSEGAALLLISDLEASPLPKRDKLQDIFGLTQTEAALARSLLTGAALKEVAPSLSISEGHARQRLKSIFQKTSTCRQAQLIALLLKAL